MVKKRQILQNFGKLKKKNLPSQKKWVGRARKTGFFFSSPKISMITQQDVTKPRDNNNLKLDYLLQILKFKKKKN